MPESQKSSKTPIILIVVGLAMLASLPVLQWAWQQAQERKAADSTVPSSLWTEQQQEQAERYVSELPSFLRQARDEALNYNPHVNLPNERVVMIQDDQMATMAYQDTWRMGVGPGGGVGRGSVMVQAEPGYCVDGEHLHPRMPEGSETGCECGASCDENGKPTNPEGTSCKRHCSRDLCKCGTCI